MKCKERLETDFFKDLFGKHGDVLVEGIGGTHVPSSHPGLSGCARRELALLKDQREQREKRVTANREHRFLIQFLTKYLQVTI